MRVRVSPAIIRPEQRCVGAVAVERRGHIRRARRRATKHLDHSDAALDRGTGEGGGVDQVGERRVNQVPCVRVRVRGRGRGRGRISVRVTVKVRVRG